MRIIRNKFKYREDNAQGGFTIVEMMVSIFIFSFVMGAVFSFLWGASKYWQTGQDSADVTENARLGLNRMTRELKQATVVTTAGSNTMTFSADFGNGTENITYGFTPGSEGNSGSVWRSSSVLPQQLTMVEDVDQVEYLYFGNDYRCDSDVNGVIDWPELTACDLYPEGKIARVDIVLTLRAGSDSQKVFVGQAWLRNHDFGG